MTVITDASEVLAAEPGSSFRVRHPNSGEGTWVLGADEKLSRGGVSLPLSMFEQAIREGAVETGPVFEVGAVFRQENYDYVVISVKDEVAQCLVLRNSAYYTDFQMTPATSRSMTRVAPEPIHTLAAHLTKNWWDVRQSLQEMAKEHQNCVSVTSVNEGLSQFFENKDTSEGLDLDTYTALRSRLAEYALKIPRGKTHVTLEVEGQTRFDDPINRGEHEELGDLQDHEVTSERSERVVYWEITVEGDIQSDYSDPCEDRGPTGELVRRVLEERGIDAYDYDITARSCEHC